MAADETATGLSVAFNAGIKVPEETTDMTLYISTSKAGEGLVSVPMNYAVNSTVAGEAPSYRIGDANGDGEITVKDVVPIRRFIAGGYGVEL